ncbi:MAG: autotransporter outer membrane beta-barrel domain-containing protein [Pseudomonadota bacterium]
MSTRITAGFCLCVLVTSPALAQSPSSYPSPLPYYDSDQTKINKSAGNFFFNFMFGSNTGPTRFGPWRDDAAAATDAIDEDARTIELLEEQKRLAEKTRRELKQAKRRRESISEDDFRNALNPLEDLGSVLFGSYEEALVRRSRAESARRINELNEDLRRIERRIETLEGQLDDSAIPQLAPIVVLAYGNEGGPGQASTAPESIVALDTLSGGYNADLAGLSGRSSAQSDAYGTQFFVSGNVSFLDDSSSADRDGHVGQISLTAARRLTPRFALSGSLTVRRGEYNIDTVQSSNDYVGFAASASGAYRLNRNLSLFGGASIERGNFDTTLSTTTGSYDATAAALVAGIEGVYGANGFVLQPQAMLSYVYYDLEGYTDSAGTVVPGQNDGTGLFNAALTVSRPLPGDGSLTSWLPYATARFLYNFEDTGPVVLPLASFDDGQTFATIGVGAMFRFDNGGEAGLGLSYTDALDGDLGAFTVGALLTLPLN